MKRRRVALHHQGDLKGRRGTSGGVGRIRVLEFKPRRLLQLLALCLILIPPVIKLVSGMKIGAGSELWPLAETLSVLISSVIFGTTIGGDIGRVSDKISAIPLQALGWTFLSIVFWLTVNPFIKVMGVISLFRFHAFLFVLSLAGGALGLLIGSLFEEPAYRAGTALIVVAICLGAVFWVNLLLGESSGYSPLILKFAIDANPIILASTLLGGDPMHTKYLYEISEVSFYRFRYPKLYLIVLEYLLFTVLSVILFWIVDRTKMKKWRLWI